MITAKVRGAIPERNAVPENLCLDIAAKLLQCPQYWTKFGQNANYHSAYFGPIYGKSKKYGGRNHPLLDELGAGYDYIMSWPDFLIPLREIALKLMKKNHDGIQEIYEDRLQCNINAYKENSSIIKGRHDYLHSNGCVSWHTDEPYGVFEPKFFGEKTITICILGGGRFSVRRVRDAELKQDMVLPDAYKADEDVYARRDPKDQWPIERNDLDVGDGIVLVGAALHGCKHAAVMTGSFRVTANFRMVSAQNYDFSNARRLGEQPAVPVGIRVPPPQPNWALRR